MHPRYTIQVSPSDYRGVNAWFHAWTGNPLYAKGESNFFASSQQSPACVVEPGTPEDVGRIVRSSRSVIWHRVPSSLRRPTPVGC